MKRENGFGAALALTPYHAGANVAETGGTEMGILLIAVLIGLLPASIARSKGRPFVLWWIYGAALFIVALPHALLLKPDQGAIEVQALSSGMKKCPSCAELIKSEAKICRYCQNLV